MNDPHKILSDLIKRLFSETGFVEVRLRDRCAEVSPEQVVTAKNACVICLHLLYF